MDTRRKEREMKRNKRMTATLSGISVIFAISWLPYHAYLILTDIFILGVSIQIFKPDLGHLSFCHLFFSLMFVIPFSYIVCICYICLSFKFLLFSCHYCWKFLVCQLIFYVCHTCLSHYF
jgi:hypothetical protein